MKAKKNIIKQRELVVFQKEAIEQAIGNLRQASDILETFQYKRVFDQNPDDKLSLCICIGDQATRCPKFVLELAGWDTNLVRFETTFDQMLDLSDEVAESQEEHLRALEILQKKIQKRINYIKKSSIQNHKS